MSLFHNSYFFPAIVLMRNYRGDEKQTREFVDLLNREFSGFEARELEARAAAAPAKSSSGGGFNKAVNLFTIFNAANGIIGNIKSFFRYVSLVFFASEPRAHSVSAETMTRRPVSFLSLLLANSRSTRRANSRLEPLAAEPVVSKAQQTSSPLPTRSEMLSTISSGELAISRSWNSMLTQIQSRG